jgi:pentatricopeptide repeat protein
MIDNIDPDQRLSEKKDIRFSEMVTESILLRSFSSNQVFHELHRLMEDMRKEGRETEQI